MNRFPASSLPENPFTRLEFWNRQNELRTICKRLASEPPQCCAIIGETHIGKTTLLRHLTDQQSASMLADLGIQATFVYLDCKLSINLALGDFASVQFWWSLYREARATLQPDGQPELTEPAMTTVSKKLVDTAYEFKSTLEGLIRYHEHPVIFVLDNFEEIARLPLRDSEWLRSLAQRNCAYVVSSRHLLYLLYQYDPENWANPSPLWNLFSDPIYLGLLPENEVKKFLVQACAHAREFGSIWTQQDIDFIAEFAGRHAELIRIACKNLFEQRLPTDPFSEIEENEFDKEFLELRISRDARAICNQLWFGLADPELSDVPRVEGSSRENEPQIVSPHQKGLIDVAKGHIPADRKILFVLEQRGLIERVNSAWRVFAEVMRQFVLKQEQAYSAAGYTGGQYKLSSIPHPVPLQADFTDERREEPIFTYLEGKVYDYLKSRLGDVCDREEIKQAVWESNLPTNTALQKIIERIREKIEPDPENPRYLIAIRGQGYMLRGESAD